MFPRASLDNGALSFASSGASRIVTVGALNYGADGPAASGAETCGTLTTVTNDDVWRCSVTNAASNLTLTDGTAITLSTAAGG